MFPTPRSDLADCDLGRRLELPLDLDLPLEPARLVLLVLRSALLILRLDIDPGLSPLCVPVYRSCLESDLLRLCREPKPTRSCRELDCLRRARLILDSGRRRGCDELRLDPCPIFVLDPCLPFDEPLKLMVKLLPLTTLLLRPRLSRPEESRLSAAWCLASTGS